MRRISLFSFFVSIIFISNIFAAQIEWEVPFSKEQLKLDGRVAVILGAGPAGLIAARAILKSNQHDHVVIVEKRPKFSRFNMVNFFPESWPMLTNLGLDQTFRSIIQSLSKFYFHLAQPNRKPISFLREPLPIPTVFDYHGKISSILLNPQVGFDVVNLAELQHEIAEALVTDQRVKLIHGTSVVSETPNDDSLHTIEIFRHGEEKSSEFVRLTPDLIVIAEGAHSENRNRIGIQMKPILDTQYWCSGSVSLKPIETYSIKNNFMTVFDQGGKTIIRTFGIFNARPSELFLNGLARSDEHLEACLKRNAVTLIAHAITRLGYFAPDLPSEKLEIVRKIEGQKIIEIVPSKASRFSSGRNIITLGDASGNGSPQGGIGLSLVITFYAQALLDLLQDWQQDDRNHILDQYNNRVSEIVDYWHTKMKSDSVLVR